MGLETGNVISDLVAANPLGSDPKSTSDDHHRLIKKVLRQSFAGFAGSILVTGTDTGSINTYVLTPATPLLAYGQNMIVVLRPINSNTGASTLNISGLGAVSILAQDGSALAAGDLAAGVETILVYNGTNFQMSSVSKSYIDNLSFAGSLPSAPIDGAVPQYLNGSIQWAYVSNMYPLGDSIPQGQLVAINQAGNSASVGAITSTVVTTTATDEMWKTGLTGGNLLTAYLASNVLKVTVEHPTTGVILYGPITVSSTGTQTGIRCYPTTSGGAILVWLRSGVGAFYAIVSSTGAVTLSETAVSVVATSAGTLSAAQLTNSNILFGVKDATGQASYTIMSTAGAVVKAQTLIEAVAVSGDVCAIALSNGYGALLWGTSTQAKMATVTNTGTYVLTTTVIATATNANIRAAQLTNGNIACAYLDNSFAYAMVVTTGGAVAVAAAQISTVAIASDMLHCAALTGGSFAVGFAESSNAIYAAVLMADGTVTTPKFRVGTGTVTSGELAFFASLNTNSNSFYFGYQNASVSSYQTFTGPYKNNYIVGISRGYTTTKQLVDAFGEYDIGASTVDTLEKKVNYVKVSTRLIF